MKHFRGLFIFAAGAFFAAACAAQPGGFLDGIVALVNDSVITDLQVEDQIIAQLPALRIACGTDTNKFYSEVNKLRENELELMERGKLILDDFTKGQYTTNWVDDAVKASVDQELKEVFSGRRENLVKTLHAEGRTYEDYLKQKREMIIVENMVHFHTGSGKIIISPSAIENYYNEHAGDYKLEDQVKLRVIQIPQSAGSPPGTARELAGEILRKIDSGVPFAEMANEMAAVNSATPQRAAGGDLGWKDRNGVIKELADVAFSLKAGQHSTVVEVPGQGKDPASCYLLMVDDVRPAHVRPLSEVEGDIERTLQVQKGKSLEDQWIKRLEAKARIFNY
jgi:parvulin-like peptidyl-prolyl isomerase